MIIQTFSEKDGLTHNACQTTYSLTPASLPSARGTVYSYAGSWFGIFVVIVLVFMSGFAIFTSAA